VSGLDRPVRNRFGFTCGCVSADSRYAEVCHVRSVPLANTPSARGRVPEHCQESGGVEGTPPPALGVLLSSVRPSPPGKGCPSARVKDLVAGDVFIALENALSTTLTGPWGVLEGIKLANWVEGSEDRHGASELSFSTRARRLRRSCQASRSDGRSRRSSCHIPARPFA